MFPTTSLRLRIFQLVFSFLHNLPRSPMAMPTSTMLCPRGCSCDRQISSRISSPAAYTENGLSTSGLSSLRIDCAGRHFDDFVLFDLDSAGAFVNITVDLDLSRNGFNQLPLSSSQATSSTTFGVSRLRLVDLSNNDFKFLVYASLSQLIGAIEGPKVLTLADNEIERLDDGCFTGLDELESLTLTGNRISQLQPANFFGMNRLKRLDVDRNLLTSLPQSVFSCLPSLTNVSLAYNRITVVDRSTFGTNVASTVQPAVVGKDSSTYSSQADTQTTPGSISSAASNRSYERKVIANQSTDYFCNMGTKLPLLEHIDLSNNFLTAVPDWGPVSSTLVSISLDGNPIRYVGQSAFASMPRLLNVSMSLMPELVTVDRRAFTDVPKLSVIRLNSNRRLGFLDSEAFDFGQSSYRNRMLIISLHDNALQSVPNVFSLTSAIPTGGQSMSSTLVTLSFGGNPFHCDCNIRWLREILNIKSDAVRIADSKSIRCDSPTSVRGQLVSDIRLDIVSADTCIPVAIPFFNAELPVMVGDQQVRIDCRAIGRPRPRIHWILPNGRFVNATAATTTHRKERIEVDSSGSLTVSGLRYGELGTYTCVAMNERGYDAAATTLVSMTSAVNISTVGLWPCPTSETAVGPRLLVRRVSSTFVAISWTGTDQPGLIDSKSTATRSTYSIIYREYEPSRVRFYGVDQRRQQQQYSSGTASASDDQIINRIRISPYMRAFTVTNLRPLTTYEFCIGCDQMPASNIVQPPSKKSSAARYELPAPPLSVGRGQQQPLKSPPSSVFNSASESCVRVRTSDRRSTTDVDDRTDEDDVVIDGRNMAELGESVEATAAGVVRTAFGIIVLAALIGVVSLCALLIGFRRSRGRRRRRLDYADPAADRTDDSGDERHDHTTSAGVNSNGAAALRDYHTHNGHACLKPVQNGGNQRNGYNNSAKNVGGRVTLIPLSNLADLPSTNLSSSRTSLLHEI